MIPVHMERLKRACPEHSFAATEHMVLLLIVPPRTTFFTVAGNANILSVLQMDRGPFLSL
jgi:hypothetical protein